MLIKICVEKYWSS